LESAHVKAERKHVGDIDPKTKCVQVRDKKNENWKEKEAQKSERRQKKLVCKSEKD
jgi:hypothetical protein